MEQKLVYLRESYISYFEVNPTSEKTIVFIHGNSHSKSTFEYQLNNSDFNEYRLISFDLPGHGHSSVSDHYSIPYFTEVLEQLLLELNIKDYILVGHSLGGHIAMESLKSLNPAGIVIFGAPPIGAIFNPLECYKSSTELALLFKEDLNDTEIESLTKALYFEERERGQEKQDIKKVDPHFKVSFAQSIAENHYYNEIELLQKCRSLTVFHGIHDHFLNSEYLLSLDLKLWQSKVINFNAGHNIHRESESLFNQQLHHFVKDSFEMIGSDRIIPIATTPRSEETSYSQI